MRAAEGEIVCGDCDYRPASAVERDSVGNQVDAVCAICAVRRGPRGSVGAGEGQVVIGGRIVAYHKGAYNSVPE